MRHLQSLGAVLAGFASVAALVMLTTHGAAAALGVSAAAVPTAPYLLLNLLGSMLAAGVGGLVCARLAPLAPRTHVVALAATVLLLALPAAVTGAGPGQPQWYPQALAVLAPAGVLAGGLLRGRIFRGA